MSKLQRLPQSAGFFVIALAAFLSQTSSAQLLSDDFTTDNSLNSGLWTTSSSLLAGLAVEFNSTLIIPTLSFDVSGMNVSGVNGNNELAGVQSLATFHPPFTATTTVTADEAHGNAYELFLISADLSQWMALSGNLNPGNGSYFGVWVNYDNSGLPFLSLGDNLYSNPSINAQYTIQIFVENTGIATVSLFSSGGILGVQSNLNLGTGPFHLILGQREGGPIVSGQNIATWKNVSLTSLAPAPVLAPMMWTNGMPLISWTAVAGATYQAQYTSALSPAQWNDLGPPITAASSVVTVTDAPASDAQRFYRVVLMP
ncbi:MAG TPA: hypothetical protein VG754_04180 [Verrucomicrobiae bacterium]|nr:hypothetical protein [Verrucomicrobiae bacterium]